ncbi:MAG TPA: ubiquinol-cytochrome c reductase iron-sulfur subunit [Methylobacter sp.]|jgi:ubiquinol-cytochrome c reductase iron-sulfur subunit
MSGETKYRPLFVSEAEFDRDRYVHLDDTDLRTRRYLLTATSIVGGMGVLGAVVPFVGSMEPSAKARSEGGPTDVNIADLRLGELATVVWRGKPVWLFRRDTKTLDAMRQDRPLLADPDSERSVQPVKCRNATRSLFPDLAVIVGVCTHLGCSPVMRDANAAGTGSLASDWPGGFFCPCHGSKFDLAGRVFKNVPAPINLEIPPYSYVSPTKIRIGADGAD